MRLMHTNSMNARASKPRLRILPTPTPAAPVASRTLVVLDLTRPAATFWALRRASALARDRDSSLTVLVVTPRHDNGALGYVASLTERARALCARLGLDVESGAFLLRSGYPTVMAEAAIRDVGASFVIVGAPANEGRHWVRVARRTGVPVLVAREPRREGRILAATDFSDDRFPTFRAAVSLAKPKAGHVLLLHNMNATSLAFPRTRALLLSKRAFEAIAESRKERILTVAAEATVTANAVLTTNKEAEQAVIEHACRADVDVVVVGARGRSGRSDGRRQRTADSLVERLHRSALVVPLDSFVTPA